MNENNGCRGIIYGMGMGLVLWMLIIWVLIGVT